ncbi:phage/conjugal plasmid C-4 type zinc finger protein, TraR family [Rosenbergiella nectarea]|uniref:Phage/conjugal plasmid C-4 type zinc finger protein, TraR family n=1 Tax=Rosenbergiella nectarea TaxID=988801 RepID=A0A1H9F233_9GAMM|nr:TraR/DksA C4-type zinc finger protein [Rosenbergiella nectarea]SEQ32016.1 phage/conjugal plasmid C-4 type zinc finger protein, TraR family [Rosenbergiella nectarea]
MADSMDFTQERTEEMRQRNVDNVLNRQKLPSRSFCVDCDMPIPELRRRTLIDVERCVDCQQISEIKKNNFRGK